MTAQHILQLGQMVGLSCNELIITDHEQTIGDVKTNDEMLVAQVLADFGFTDDLVTRLEDEVKHFWLQALPPVIVVDELSVIQFDLHLPIEFVTEDLIWEVRSKQDTLQSGVFTPIEWELNGIYHLHDMEIQGYQIGLQQPLSVGKYQLVILDQGSEEPLGEATLLCPPLSLAQRATPSRLTALSRLTESSTIECEAPSAATMLDSLLDATFVAHSLVVRADNGTELFSKLGILKAYFSAQQTTADFVQSLQRIQTSATDYQHCIASYFTAYENAELNAAAMCARQQTLTADWQEEHAGRRQFYLWLVCSSNGSMSAKEAGKQKQMLQSICFSTDDSNTFSSWLLAEYRLAHCDLTDAAGIPLGQGINSYKLRQSHYAAFIQLIEYMAVNSTALILNQPLSIMQQWLAVAEQGIWQNHEFHELLSIILLYCELQDCPCYYQADAQLPDELTEYLQARGIPALKR
jgi:hypothetical protein